MKKSRIIIPISIVVGLITLVAIAAGIIRSGKILKVDISLVDKTTSDERTDESELIKPETVSTSEYSKDEKTDAVSSNSIFTQTTTRNNSITNSNAGSGETEKKPSQTSKPVSKTESESYSPNEIRSRIRILGAEIWEYDSACGVTPGVYWRNESNKTIKYIHFKLTPYNAVNDPVPCTIRGYSTVDCTVTGPIEHTDVGMYIEVPEYSFLERKYTGNMKFTSVDYDYKADSNGIPSYFDEELKEYHHLSAEEIERTGLLSIWSQLWYNSDIQTIRVEGIRIEYMDGEEFVIGKSQIKYASW